MDREYTLYVHIFPNEKMYFGVTKQEVNIRWAKGEGYKKQPKIYKAIQTYGWDNIVHKILETGLTSIEAQEKEKQYIREYGTINNGYNTSAGGGLGSNEWMEFEYNGALYKPSELAKVANEGITSHDITTRMGRDWDIKRTLTQQKNVKTTQYEYRGKIYTIDELYEKRSIDIARRIFLLRLQRGWDIERALTQPTNKKLQPCLNYYEYEGKYYTVKQLVKMSNVSDITEIIIRERINRGWSVKRAIIQPLKRQNTVYDYRGNKYTTKQLASLSPYNLTHHHIADRLRSGWDIEKAVNTPLMNK